jgi:signal transduction histidine kinase
VSATGRRRRLFGTAARLSGFLAVLLAAVLALTAFNTERAFTSRAMTTTNNDLAAALLNFSRAAADTPPAALRSFSVRYLSHQVLPAGEVVVVRLPGGAELGSAGSSRLLRSAALRSLLVHPPTRTVTRQVDLDQAAFETELSPIVERGRVVGTFVAAADLAQLRTEQHSVFWLVFGEAGVALLAAVAGTFLLLRRLLRTVGDITTTAQAIETGEVDQRIGDPGTDDEVGQLASTFNSMLDRIDDSMTTQRQMLSDVSHQLRTPLTVARGHLEVLERVGADNPAEVRETIRVVIDELDHMRSMVERLLLLGRALEPDFLELERLDLRSFVADMFDVGQVLAPRHWLVDPVPDLVLQVDVAKLRGAVLNLLDNAVHATGADDVIEVSASRGPDGSVAIAVDDSGPGIPEHLRAGSLSRFGRPGASDTDGSGLGLAIVTAVAEAHGGRLELGVSARGGCRAAIVLPPGRVLAHEPRPLVPT